jgi:lipopolysaccharide export LptBFGC system permease protein LptF
MIIVSSISLSTMLSNNLLIPYGFIGSLKTYPQEKKNSKRIQQQKIDIYTNNTMPSIAYLF